MAKPRIRAKGFSTAMAMAVALAAAAPGNSHAQYRIAGHPAHVSALPRQPMPTLRNGIGVAAPAAQAGIVQHASPVTTDHARDARDHDHPQDHDRARTAFATRVAVGVIVGGVSSGYYYGPPTYYAPGYYGNQYSDGGPAVGPSPFGDNDNGAACQTYSSYDPQAGTYIGDDGTAHRCP